MTFDQWWLATGSDAFAAFPVSAATAKIAARKVWDASRGVVPTVSVSADMHVRIAASDEHGGPVLQYAPPAWGAGRELGYYACFKIAEPELSMEALIALIHGVDKQLENPAP